MEHTKEPWTAQHHTLQDGSGGKKWYEIMGNGGKGPALAKMRGWTIIDEANAQHIVDCVNACENINPKAVQPLLEACKEAQETIDSFLVGKIPQESRTGELNRILGNITQAIALAERGK